ncbi:DNA repair exonuclease SbcCD nuclease subunit [Oceanobacillus limi]|uniref:DNA repair exonuclease SbcCD nuclease subunit n=1 Tax=Oceanobacillus limi TaxID=930131 RepID=A0A1H9YKB6_9BACI|nr:DNA repair exonuclease [Oceanobacillus limi]SES69446.1 DNA repair exonuclease SbcCD nuclease subunit [Oceanobacillus limi]
MAKEVSFIHAADLHLDSPFKGLANLPERVFQDVRNSTFSALDKLVIEAIQKQVDFVLLVGDLFDHEVQSLKAQVKLRDAFQQLEAHDIKVYLSYGNHDYIKGNRHPIMYPPNVFIFPSEEVQQFTYGRDGEELAKIYGFSYENRAVTDRKVPQYKVMNSEIPFHIAMLHGSIENDTEHDNYAPFQRSDFDHEPFSYWALGHIHQRQVIKDDPPVVYPGNIQGRSRKEAGKKGCYYVKLSELGHTMEFIPLQSIEFCSIVVDAFECEEIHELEGVIRSCLKQEFHQTEIPQLIHLTIKSKADKLLEWKKGNRLADLIEIINEKIIESPNWRYIYRYRVKTSDKAALQSHEGEYFIGELAERTRNAGILPYLDELFQHKEARKHIEFLADEEIEEIKNEAYELLIHELLEK